MPKSLKFYIYIFFFKKKKTKDYFEKFDRV
jgi:hypothetical protein